MSAKLIRVIEVWTTRGDGTEANPCRTIRQYWSIKGELLAEFDPNPQPPSHFVLDISRRSEI